MGDAKRVIVRVIPSNIARPFIIKHHYSRKAVNNSNLHFGAFIDNKLHGVMSFGPSIDKSKILPLVDGTGWNEMLELNRMAFDDALPRNSESRCIAQAIRMIKKNAPQIKWIISFADGCQCGDGAIYRASNFVLTQIKKNDRLLILPSGEVKHALDLATVPNKRLPELGGRTFAEITGGAYSEKKYCEITGAKPIEGYQLRYIYFIDPEYRKRLTVLEIPYSKIQEIGAGMYKGEKR